MDFAELARAYMNHYEHVWRSNTNPRLVREWHDRLEHITFENIDVKLMDQWKAQKLVERRLPSTINRKLAVIKHMFRKGVQWGMLKKNPLEYLELLPVSERRLRYLSEEEERVLTQTLDSGIVENWLRDIVIVALDTGMRQGELITLRSSDLDSRNDMIVCYQSKTQRTKMIPMTKRVKEVFSERKTISFNRVSPRTINRSFNKLVASAGISNFRFHDLRHTFASKLAIKGVPVHVISELLGHTNIQMTMRYAHLSPKAKREAIEKL